MPEETLGYKQGIESANNFLASACGEDFSNITEVKFAASGHQVLEKVGWSCQIFHHCHLVSL